MAQALQRWCMTRLERYQYRPSLARALGCGAAVGGWLGCVTWRARDESEALRTMLSVLLRRVQPQLHSEQHIHH